MTDFCIIMPTCNRQEIADAICKALVGERLAACVHIMPLQTHYRWKGDVVTDSELLLMIKTRSSMYAAVAGRVRSIHDYETPQVTMLPIVSGLPDYLAWLRENTTGTDGTV